MPARRPKDRYKVFESKPAIGGNLITRGSADNAGVFNYTVKRCWRRDLDVEVRREGHDYFYPNTNLPIAGQPFPGQIQLDSLTYAAGVVTATRIMGQWFEDGESVIIQGASDAKYNGTFAIYNATATTFQYSIGTVPVSPDPSASISATPIETINLLAMARRPNGQTAVIAGSSRRLYRYYALDDGDYISKEAADYPPGTPVNQLFYWSEDPADYPLGTIASQLMYVDDDPGYWIVIGSGFSTEGKRWEVESINGWMVFNNGVDLPCTYRVEELSVVPIYELREQGVSSVGTISSINGILLCADISEIQADQLADWFNTASDPYAVYTDQHYINRTQYRVLWGIPDYPRRWAAIVPGSITVGTNVLTLDYPVLGFGVGQKIVITGAGAPHAGSTSDNLSATIVNITGSSVILDVFAGTTVASSPVEAFDMIGSIVGYEDLQDDGSAILKMMPLADQLVIYKDTSIFLGQYIGSIDQPFAFSIRKIAPESSLFYRNTLVSVVGPNEIFHLYAGRNSFYRFDLTNQQPLLLPHFESCSNVFFDQATLANTEAIFAATNGITHEVNFVFPSANTDKAICWDFKQDTISTVDYAIAAAATIRRPAAGIASGAVEDWFVMGTSAGAVLIYGLANNPQTMPGWGGGKGIWYRRGNNPYSSDRTGYDSLLTSGLGTFGLEYGEKDVRSLLVLLGSQSPNSSLKVNLYSCQNANDTPVLQGSMTFANPATVNHMPVAFRDYLFQNDVFLTGMDNAARLVGVVWSVAPVDSRSFGRA